MIDATVTEKLALCMIKENKTLNSVLSDTNSYLLLSLLLEMADEGCLTFSDKKFKWYEAQVDGAFRLTGMPPYEKHKRLLYDALSAYEKPDIPFTYAINPEKSIFREENTRAVVDCLTELLISKGLVRREKKRLAVSEEAFRELSEELRNGILGQEAPPEETHILLVLAESWGGVLKRFFNAYERKAYKKRIKEIMEDKSNPKIAAVLKLVELKDEEDCATVAMLLAIN